MRFVLLSLALLAAGCVKKTSLQNGAKVSESLQPADRVLRLPELLDFSLKNHPKLKEAHAYIKEARYGIDEVNAARNPRIDFSATVGALGGNGSASPAANGFSPVGGGASYLYSTSVTLRQVIADFGRTRWRGLAAAMHEKTASEMYRLQQESLTEQLSWTYINSFALQSRAENRQIALMSAQEIETITKKRFEAGDVPKLDYNRAQMLVTKAETDLNNSKRDFRNSLTQLSTLSLEQYPTPDKIVFSNQGIENIPVPEVTQGIQKALQNRPEVVALDFSVAASKATIEAIRADNGPTLSVEGMVNFAGGSGMAGGPGWGVFLTLNIPLHDGGITDAKVNQAKASLEALTSKKDTLKLEITNEVQTVHNNLSNAASNMELAKSLDEKSRANLALVQKSYKMGISKMQEVVDAFQAAADAAQSATDTQNDYLKMLVQWKKATSTSVRPTLAVGDRPTITSGGTVISPIEVRSGN